jgi:hypothetical protein
MTASLKRRNFFKLISLAAGSVPALTSAARSRAAGLPNDRASGVDGASDAAAAAPLQWLGGRPSSQFTGTTWGTPWPQGRVTKDSGFVLDSSDGARTPVQSWPLAYWPDGSIKWSAHALAPQDAGHDARSFTLSPVPVASDARSSADGFVTENADDIRIDTGVLQGVVAKTGVMLFHSLARIGHVTLSDGHLVVLTDETSHGTAASDEAQPLLRREYRGWIDTATVEHAGASRAVLKLSGTHRPQNGNAEGMSAPLIPFVVRLYFYKGSDAVRVVHSLIYDADPARTFIRGVGLRFSQALSGELHDRYVRFAGDDGGVFREAVRGLTGLRRDPGNAVTAAQLAGRATPPVAEWPPVFAHDLRFVPAFGHYRLLQPNPDGFTIAKRTQRGCGWIRSASGTRAPGTAYLGDARGGVAFGIRNFWQSYPAQIDIADAHTDRAAVTLWLWAPDAPAMDLRAYHDDMGEDSYALQRDALDITYEDYEPGFASPYGIGRTSEIELQLFDSTPSNDTLAAVSRRIQNPPRLLPSSAWMHEARAFSAFWHPAQVRPTPQAARLQQQLGWQYDYYRGQIAQRKWYGFWDYGDVMHTYDAARHVWRYDVGGFAWDNGELSTEIWLWHYFLHSGRADVFLTAEAMTRHCSEVDVHHIGRFSPLGSRHDVQHWGDSAKQLRVSTVTNHRFFYYLTADERTGDLLREQVDAVERLRQILPGRKIGQSFPALDPEHHASVSFGTDWGAVSAAWLTEWERTGEPHYRDKLLASMQSIADQPHGFFTGIGVMDLRTGRFIRDTTGTISVSHLSAVFGLPEVCSELLRCLPDTSFRDAWLKYCTLYSATPQQQIAALGQSLGKLNLSQGHARLLAFAGVENHQPALVRRAWAQFFAGKAGITYADQTSRRIGVPEVLDEIDEAPVISTNAAAQWGLGAIGLLALAAQSQPEDHTG